MIINVTGPIIEKKSYMWPIFSKFFIELMKNSAFIIHFKFTVVVYLA